VLIINDTNSAKTVNWERDRNTAPFIIREILSNKPLYFLRVIRENYLEAFSTNFLFLYGETSGLGKMYGMLSRGVLYIIELPLLLFGIWYLLKLKDKRIKTIIFGLLLIAPLPAAFTIDRSYVMRSIMMLPMLSLIIGSGIFFFLQSLQSQKSIVSKIVICIFIGIYSFLITEYLYQYYFRYSVYGAEAWFRSSKDVAQLIGQQKAKFSTIYIADAGDMFILQYAIFNKIDPILIQQAWKQPPPKKIGNVIFLSECFKGGVDAYDPNIMLPKKTMYIVPDTCHKSSSPIDRINDLGEPIRTIWKIYEK
jgi:hypothetical protein